MKQYLTFITKACVYLIFFVPLVVVPSSFIFPFIVPKILLFRSLTMLALAAFVMLLIINWREFRPKITPLTIALTLFFVSFALSTFIGVDAYHSFWDNHERMLGLFTIFHFVAFYFICSSLFHGWSDWKWAMRIFLLAGSVVMFIGLMQTQNPEMLLNQGSERVASTLGNSIYVGGYGLFLSFVAFLLAIREKNIVWRWIEAICGILGILGMFYSGTRGSMLGFLAGILTAIVGYIIVLNKHPRIRIILAVIGISAIVGVSLLYYFRSVPYIKNLPAVGRAVNTSFSDIKASPRWVAWTIALESWKERPVFGWGPNNFFFAFNKYYNPRSLEFGYGETWFDNAHNIIVNTLSVQGSFGLLTYLCIFGVAIFVLWRGYKRGEANYHVVVIGTAFLLAHLVQNVTVFENPTSYLYFMFWLALVNGLTGVKTLKHENIKTLKQENDDVLKSEYLKIGDDKKIGLGLVVSVSVVAVFIIYVFNIQPARANMKTLDTIRMLSTDPTLGVVLARETFAFGSPHIDDIRSDISRTVGQLLRGNNQNLGKDRSNEMLKIVYTEMKKNLLLHPLDIRSHLLLSELATSGYIINNDTNYLLDAEGFYNDALTKSPKRQQIIFSAAIIKLQLGKTDEAIKLFEQAISDDPKIGESYWRLAYVYKVMGRNDKAKETIDLAYKNGVKFSDTEKDIVEKNILNNPVVATATVKK